MELFKWFAIYSQNTWFYISLSLTQPKPMKLTIFVGIWIFKPLYTYLWCYFYLKRWLTGLSKPDVNRYKICTNMLPQEAIFLHWRWQDHTTFLIWQITQVFHPFGSPMCDDLTYLPHMKMIWLYFVIVTTWTEWITYYRTNNFTMKNHLNRRRILIEITKEFQQKHCWKTLIHLYNYKKRF